MATLSSRFHKSGEHELPFPSPGRKPHSHRSWWSRWSTRRWTRLILICILSLLLITFFRNIHSQPIVEIQHSLPPLYEEWHQRELALPQHNPELAYPEGKTGKYLFASNYVTHSGWGNAMQEFLLDSHLAHEAGWSFVFPNYTWNTDGSDYSDFNGKLIPSRIPLSAIMSGPTVGGPFPAGDLAPRAVKKEYWDEVCQDRLVIDSDVVTGQLPPDPSAAAILNKWVEYLGSVNARCVEVSQRSTQLFSIWVFGSERVLDIWPSLKSSPILTQFRWSPLVQSAFDTNRHLFDPRAPSPLRSWLPFLFPPHDDPPPSPTNPDPYPIIPGLLALHIRRGDFSEHCLHLAKWSSTYNGFNRFPSLPDRFDPPPASGWGETTEENVAAYLKTCAPDVGQIVEKVEAVRRSAAGEGLRNVYVMTNGAAPWVEEVKAALRARWDGWEAIVSSRDVRLSWEQKYVAQAVDMLIGQRAQVFVGNGFSSLTSNIVMMRMARDVRPDSNRFW